MAETFYLGEKKSRPGLYYRRESADLIGSVGATNGVVACVFKSNWGSSKVQTVTINQMSSLEDLYGEAAPYLREIFIGGARTLRAVRAGGTGGACSKVTLKTDEETPKDAVEISARFEGNRSFDVSVRTNLVTNRRQVIFYSGTTTFETIEFDSGGDEAEKLVLKLKTSRNFIGVKKNAGALASVDQAKMTGGVNPTSTNDDYAQAFKALERFRWNCVVADSDDAAIRNQLYNFVLQGFETGHFGIAVIAGKSSETLEDRMQLATGINSEWVVYVLNGWTDLDGASHEGYLAAARIAGMIAGSETNSSVALLPIANALDVIENLSNGELIDAVEHGCLALRLNDSDQVVLDSAITTLVTLGNQQDAGWQKIRRTRTRQELLERINRTCEKLIARLPNDSNGRATICAAAQGVINDMCAENKLVAGSKIEEDPRYKPDADFAYFLISVLDLDSLEKCYFTFRFSFSSNVDETASA